MEILLLLLTQAQLCHSFENTENIDGTFLDIANLWGVDYDSSLDDNNKIRSSIGIGMIGLHLLGH